MMEGSFLQFSMMLQMDIQARNVVGFCLMVLGSDSRIEHLHLLYKPGPTPDSFTPIVIANFTPTSIMPHKVSATIWDLYNLINYNLKVNLAVCTVLTQEFICIPRCNYITGYIYRLFTEELFTHTAVSCQMSKLLFQCSG